MSFQVMYVKMITKDPKREKAEVILISLRLSVVFPTCPKPSVVGAEVVAMLLAMVSR